MQYGMAALSSVGSSFSMTNSCSRGTITPVVQSMSVSESASNTTVDTSMATSADCSYTVARRWVLYAAQASLSA